jgi:flavin reductase (DIM6/NTAB) family NADH-FMN oxidoreductase RutF
MFYKTDSNNHGFPHDPFKAIVTPRPIGWIGSVDKGGVANLAPHSYFNAISDNPYFVIFGSITYKDTVRNIEETGDFTCSLVSEDLFDEMNSSSVPADPKIDEFNLAGIKKEPGKLVKSSFVKGCTAALECKLWKTIDIPGSDRSKLTGNYSIIGEVIGIHINDKYIKDGMFNTKKVRPIARLGYMDYGVVGEENIFSKNRPKLGKDGKLESVKKWDGVYR